MGGDFGPHSTIPASVLCLEQDDNLSIVLFGDEKVLSPFLVGLSSKISSRLSVVHCTQSVEMSDRPSYALRNKPDSSMRRALESLRDGKVEACVSSGSTGALMGLGCYLLKTSPGIDRPAICTAIPTVTGYSYLLDLGANVDTNSDSLYQFAMMGSVLASAVDGVASPKVALLNIGEEEVKGNEQVKLAAALLSQESMINYVGYVEGDNLYSGSADVIVCDGFVGNIALKTSEGVVKFISHLGRELFGSGVTSKLLAVAAKPLFDRLEKRINPQNHNGAYFLGLQGVVVKSHGNASAEGFAQAIHRTTECVRTNMISLLDEQLELLAR
ncbi:phosphate:acyl-[acyl carrier protein] acyltransferase [Sinobacterium caligoides]|uniref:Phosphate acyltransferase n=2 Tax=Sinobacterium caligoides TaxID=933926 RepID=A0A3N2DJT6_9GAMM|nr:phosphate:acyl-[acyl carrier protein] acyltransferase [Sinobacterium caligoides]